MSYSINFVNTESNKKLFNVVSTFSGAGGSSVGYKLAGGNVLMANEISKEVCEIYKLNHPKTKMVNKDIKDFNINFNNIDILDGSPPCKKFSIARAKKKEYITRTEIDKNLIFDYLNLVKLNFPKICIVENVREFLNDLIFNEALKAFKELGYIVNYKILNAVNYGVPQSRIRLFIIAIRIDIANKLYINEESLINLFPQKFKKKIISLRESFKNLKTEIEEREYLLSSMRKSSNYEIIKFLPKCPKKKIRMSDINKNWKTHFSLNRASWLKPCATITSHGQQTFRGGICHPEEDRLFTIRELCRIMSLPDDYSFIGSFNKKAEVIGNMVPPFMLRALASNLYYKVLKPFREKNS